MTPAKNAKHSIGRNWSALMSPSLKGESLKERTSHACPTDCIHVPTSDTSCPAQKMRKSRDSRARSQPGNSIRAVGLPV
jgi:hypothetical protein